MAGGVEAPPPSLSCLLEQDALWKMSEHLPPL